MAFLFGSPALCRVSGAQRKFRVNVTI